MREFPVGSGTLLPNVAITDTGKLVRTVVQNPKTYFEKSIAFYSQGISEGEKLVTLAKGTFYRLSADGSWN